MEQNPSAVGALEQRVRALEEHVAALRGLPVPGSREDLIRLGFDLTDESRARAQQSLAERSGPATEQRTVSDRAWLGQLERRVARLEQQIGISDPDLS